MKISIMFPFQLGGVEITTFQDNYLYYMYKFHERFTSITSPSRVAGAATHAAAGMSAQNLKSGRTFGRWVSNHNARHRVVPPSYVNQTRDNTKEYVCRT